MKLPKSNAEDLENKLDIMARAKGVIYINMRRGLKLLINKYAISYEGVLEQYGSFWEKTVQRKERKFERISD